MINIKIIILIISLSILFISCYQKGEYFGEYVCTDDCSGHEAGYEWAEEKGINDIDNCGGNSQSFIEGCMYFVDTNY